MTETFATETSNAQEARVDHPAAQALLDAQNEYQRKSAGLLQSYYEGVDKLRDEPSKIDLPFPDVLTDAQKAEIIATQKAEAGQKLHESTVAQYERAVDELEKHGRAVRAGRG